MASQRREVIPKCSTHTNQELLFCENCDSVFCAACKTSPHSTSQSGSHNVIPFAVAIKRMSEILLYKANECLSKVRIIIHLQVYIKKLLNCLHKSRQTLIKIHSLFSLTKLPNAYQ